MSMRTASDVAHICCTLLSLLLLGEGASGSHDGGKFEKGPGELISWVSWASSVAFVDG